MILRLSLTCFFFTKEKCYLNPFLKSYIAGDCKVLLLSSEIEIPEGKANG